MYMAENMIMYWNIFIWEFDIVEIEFLCVCVFFLNIHI